MIEFHVGNWTAQFFRKPVIIDLSIFAYYAFFYVNQCSFFLKIIDKPDFK